MTSGPDPGELPGFWGSMVFRHAPIPRKGSGKQQQQQAQKLVTECLSHGRKTLASISFAIFQQHAQYERYSTPRQL